MIKQNFSQELQDILSYMVDILGEEYPNKLYTPEYLIVSILNNKKANANILLDNCLTSKNIDELKKIYLTWLTNNCNHLISIKDKKNEFQFNNELNDILDESENEIKNMNSQLINSEHVLLSMLNPKNSHNKIQEVFKNIGIDYNFILNKCTEEKNNLFESKKNLIKNQNSIQLSLKNDINKKIGLSNNNFINQYTVNINKLVENNNFDKLIGREEEIEQILKIFAKRKKNNVVLVGVGGCGKSHIVYGIAQLINEQKVPSFLKDKTIIKLDVISLVSGTHFRGMFEERVKNLFDELKNNSKYILFIDDIQNVLKNSNKDKDTDLTSMIDTILTDSNVRVIATCSFKDYHNSIENNTSIARKLQKLIIEPTNKKDTVKIIQQIKHNYENHHNVIYQDDAIEACVELADRYITDRTLPDSAIDIIDLCGANKCLSSMKKNSKLFDKLSKLKDDKNEEIKQGNFDNAKKIESEINLINKELSNSERYDETNKTIITVDDISQTVSDITKIPITKLSIDEKSRLNNIENILKENIIGQDEAINDVCRVIKRNKVGLNDKTKTMGNILLLGPSGCGKCVCDNTKITIRNKKTSEIEEITIKEFYERIRKT